MKTRLICLLLTLLLVVCILGGCGKDAPVYTTNTAPATTTNSPDSTTSDNTNDDFDANALIDALSGSWVPVSSSYPGGFPSAIHADSDGNFILEEVVFQYNNQLMFPEELTGFWMIEKGEPPIFLIYPDGTTTIALDLFVQDYSENTLTVSNGDQCVVYVPMSDSAIRGVGSDDPQWSSVWSEILTRMEGSWELINLEVADNYPETMTIYNEGAPEVGVLWQGNGYYGCWDVEGSCFCMDISNNMDQLMFHVEIDDTQLTLIRRLDENTVLMESAYYYKTSTGEDTGSAEQEPPVVENTDAERPAEVWDRDYRPGMENTQSTYTRPYGTTISKLSPIVRQDEMLYFVSNGILRKMVMGGNITNVQGIYAFDSAFLNPKEIQVVGDWIYVRYEYSAKVIQNKFRYYQQAIARISTDGYESELILCDMAANSDHSTNTFVVCDDVIYYTYNMYVQTSATQFTFYSGLKQYDMSTGSEFVLYEMPVEKDDRGLEIAAYTEDTILIGVPTSSWGDAEYLLYDMNTGTLTNVPQFVNYNGFFVDDNCYLTYYHDDDECRLYRYAPETGYAQELYFSEEYGWSADDPEWHYVLYADGALYASTRKGIVAIKDGTRYLLTPDPATNIRWIDDGYIYYECNNEFYRILPDGSGWEPVDWYIQ